MTPKGSPLKHIIKTLEKAAEHIRRYEMQATASLYEDGNKAAHKENMAAKTYVLVSLADDIGRTVRELPEPLANLIVDQVGHFSFSAGKAERLDSVFYMAALLYPEDYRDGEPNDLEQFIVKLKEYEQPA